MWWGNPGAIVRAALGINDLIRIEDGHLTKEETLGEVFAIYSSLACRSHSPDRSFLLPSQHGDFLSAAPLLSLDIFC